MPRPRKRKRRTTNSDEVSTTGKPSKRIKKSNGNSSLVEPRVQHPVLSQFYPLVQSLRQYIIAKLPSSSRIRRKKVFSVGLVGKSPDTSPSEVELSLGSLLDTTLVGLSKPPTDEDDRIEGWKNFSQRGDESYVTLSNGIAGFAESQALVSSCLLTTL